MLRGEGNENGEKTTVRLISKQQLCTLCTPFCTFLCRCLARLRRETTRNFLVTRFMEEMSYVLLFTFFSTATYFHLGGRQHFSFSRHRQKIFMPFFQQKMSPFFSLALAFCRSFSRRHSLACRPFSLFLCLSLSLFFKFVDMTINLSLILQTTHIETISAFRCRLY